MAGQYNWVEEILQFKRSEDAQQKNQARDQRAYDAFFGQGYGYQEAEKIALAWGLKDAGEAKLKAGTFLTTVSQIS